MEYHANDESRKKEGENDPADQELDKEVIKSKNGIMRISHGRRL